MAGTTTFNYTNLQEAVRTHYSVMGGQEKKPKPEEIKHGLSVVDMFGSSETAEQSIARIVMQAMDKKRSKTATIATPAATDKGSTQQEIIAAMVQASLKEQQGQKTTTHLT